MQLPLIQQRRFSETIAIDNRPTPKEYQVEFKLPEPKREVTSLMFLEGILRVLV